MWFMFSEDHPGYSMNNGLWQGLWRRGKIARRLCVTQGKAGTDGLGDTAAALRRRETFKNKTW